MELVRRGYYDGTALNRVVPNFLVQFGISRDINLRDEYAGLTIFDDMPNQFKFQPGFVSFAGECVSNFVHIVVAEQRSSDD